MSAHAHVKLRLSGTFSLPTATVFEAFGGHRFRSVEPATAIYDTVEIEAVAVLPGCENNIGAGCHWTVHRIPIGPRQGLWGYADIRIENDEPAYGGTD